jgi:hypothetical protein
VDGLVAGRACCDGLDGAGRDDAPGYVPGDVAGRVDAEVGRDEVPAVAGWGFQPWGVFFSQFPDGFCR